jgi:hypothetical protein
MSGPDLAESRGDPDAPTRPQLVAVYLQPAFDLLLLVGALAAALSWRPGAALMLTGATGLLAAHLFIGVSAYRAAMNRPWPAVQPLVEDDDDW